MMVKYKNRYKDIIKFQRIHPTLIQMSGGNHYRMGAADLETLEKGELTMVDPSGGPYVSVGMDMGTIDDLFKGLVVERITTGNEEGYYVYVKEVAMDD